MGRRLPSALDQLDLTWCGVEQALRKGNRGLRPGPSLARLLEEHRGVLNRSGLPPLSVEQILNWADAHRERTGRWPTHTCGVIPEAPGETWAAVHAALRKGPRGLTGGSSLYRVLREHRGVDRSARAACRAQSVKAR
jgi:hypothetical protein